MKNLIVACLLFTATVCKSQTFKYEIIDEDNYSIADNITPAKDGFLHFQVEVNKKVSFAGLGMNKLRMGVKVNKLDNSLTLIASKDFLNGEKKLLPGLYNFIKFQNHHCIVYHDIKNEDYLGNLKLAVIDETTLDVKSETTLLDMNKYKLGFETKSVIQKDISTYKTQVSESGKMLLSITEPKTEKGDRKQVYLTVFNENLQMVMEKKIVFKEEFAWTNSYVCDDKGNVFIDYSVNETGDEKIRKGDVLDQGRKIMILKPQSTENMILPVKLDGVTINYRGLVHSPAQNKVFILGAYSKGWDENHLGVFHASIDLTTFKLSAIAKTDFSTELVKKFDEDGYANSKDKKFGLSRYFSPGYLVRGDGTVDFIMTYNKTERPSMDSRGRTGASTFYTGNILDAHLVNDKIIFSRIPRDMSSGGTSIYLNFTTYSKDANLTFLYNENQNNIEKSIDDKPRFSVVQKSEVCAATVSSDGTVKRELLLKGYEAKNIALLNRIYSISANSFFILLQKLNFASMSTGDTKYARITVN